MNSDDVIICIIVTLINIAILACFTVLAIFFKKWWMGDSRFGNTKSYATYFIRL